MQTQMNKLNIKFLLLVSIFFNVYQLQADERNTDLNQTTPEDIEARVRRRAQDLNRGRVGYEDTGAPGWDNPEPMPELGEFGASESDKILTNPQGRADVINQGNAEQQTQSVIIGFFIFGIVVFMILILCNSKKVYFEAVEKDKL